MNDKDRSAPTSAETFNPNDRNSTIRDAMFKPAPSNTVSALATESLADTAHLSDELDFDAAMLKKITDAYAARFPIPPGYCCNEVVEEVVKLIAGQGAKDSERLDAIRNASWGLRATSLPTGGDDYEIGWEVIEYHMATPHERVIAEVFEDDPRKAIDAAVAAKGTHGGAA